MLTNEDYLLPAISVVFLMALAWVMGVQAEWCRDWGTAEATASEHLLGSHTLLPSTTPSLNCNNNIQLTNYMLFPSLNCNTGMASTKSSYLLNMILFFITHLAKLQYKNACTLFKTLFWSQFVCNNFACYAYLQHSV